MKARAPSPYTLPRMPRARHASRSSLSVRLSSPSALIARSSAWAQMTRCYDEQACSVIRTSMDVAGRALDVMTVCRSLKT